MIAYASHHNFKLQQMDVKSAFINGPINELVLLEICPRGNNKVVIYIYKYHDKCLLFMLELY